jgi:GrpB-like predicted nucleotidyltransferase (UPF0157 family)
MEKGLSDLSPDELGRLFPIRVVEFDEKWEGYFRKERSHLLTILGTALAVRIIHFGSTAVPGLAAKPTIDILVEIPKEMANRLDPKIIKENAEEHEIRDAITRRMEEHGYIRMKDHPTHLMFVKGYNETGYDDTCYHIHMGSIEEDQLWDRLYFMDFLIRNPDTAREYGELKRDLARRFFNDREAYTAAKTDFIRNVTEKAKWEIETGIRAESL